jgi:hypothetical protein
MFISFEIESNLFDDYNSIIMMIWLNIITLWCFVIIDL